MISCTGTSKNFFKQRLKYRTTKHRNAENKYQKRVELEQTAFLF